MGFGYPQESHEPHTSLSAARGPRERVQPSTAKQKKAAGLQEHLII